MKQLALIMMSVSVSFAPLAWAGIEAPAKPPNTSVGAVDTRRACELSMPGYLQALTTNPNDAALHNRLGVCHQHLGQSNDAVREYKRAIKLDPSRAEAWNNLGSVFHTRRDYKRAVKNYRKAIEAKPGMATAHKNLGTAFLSLGKATEGFTAYVEAFRLDPTIFEQDSGLRVDTVGLSVATQYFFYAKLSARAGRVDAALDFLSKAQAAGYRDFDKVKSDPDFKNIVQDQRFAKLVQ